MSEINDTKQLRETIRMLERKLGVLETKQFSCCGISMTQCHALVEIGRAKSIFLKELSKLLSLENSTMSRTINNLVINKLVNREIDQRDRRYITITLTETGQKIYEDIETNMNAYYKDVYQSIPEGKLHAVLDGLQILLDSIS